VGSWIRAEDLLVLSTAPAAAEDFGLDAGMLISRVHQLADTVTDSPYQREQRQHRCRAWPSLPETLLEDRAHRCLEVLNSTP
jgi:hypothetical protein